MPMAQQNEISAFTFLALCNIRKNSNWNKATRQSMTVTKGIMAVIKINFDKDYAPNTRETFRRQVLHQFVQGRIADYNPDEPDLPTNSPRAHYAISQAALSVLRSFGRPDYKKRVANFIKAQGSLIEIYKKSRRAPNRSGYASKRKCFQSFAWQTQQTSSGNNKRLCSSFP